MKALRSRAAQRPPAVFGGVPQPHSRLGTPSLAWPRLGLAALVVLVRLPSLFEPRWSSDDGYFTSGAWATSHGLTLYARVFDDNPPGIYWTYRLLQPLGSIQHHLVIQLLGTLAATASALLVFEVARRVLPPWPALLAAAVTGLVLSFPVLDGDLVNVEPVALPLFLGALVLAFSRRRWALVAAGALLGLAVTTRPSFAVDALALLVPLLAGPGALRRLLLVAIGGVLALAVVVTVMAVQGSLPAYFAVVAPADRAYILWSNRGSIIPLLLRVVVLVSGAAIGLRRATTPAGRLAAVWLPAALMGSSITPRELSHYCTEAIPALAFTSSLILGRVRLRWLAVLPAVLAVVGGAEAVLILPAQETAILTGGTAPRPMLHNFSFAEAPGYYENWFQLVLGQVTPATYANRFPGLEAGDARETAFLRAQPDGSGSKLIVLGDRPWLFVETGMLPGSHYIATNSAFWQVPSGRQDMDRAIAGACARFVVDDSGYGNWGKVLAAGGYVRMPEAPLTTYRTDRPAGGCA